jgi:hypothetical protein
MVLRKARIDPVVRSRLGEPLVAELHKVLSAVDCQQCGRPFGRFRKPVVGVDSSEQIARAAVYHKRCRPSPWRQLLEDPPKETPHLSWRAAVPLYSNSSPMFLVNPSIEAATLVDQGGWRFAGLAVYEALGFSLDGTKQFTPLPGLRASLMPGRIAVSGQTSLPGVGFAWSCALGGGPSLIAETVKEQGHLMVGVSQRLDFTAMMTSDHVMDLLERQQIAWAMAVLDQDG